MHYFPDNYVANPAYASRIFEPAATFAKLPASPRNSSPVPRLTSLYHFHEAGDYGDRSYPGNCGGNLIRDLLLYFKPQNVFDPMTGSGTCRDVCRSLDLECWSGDIHANFDLADTNNFYGPDPLIQPRSFDFTWIHPPYWRQKLYCRRSARSVASADSRNISRTLRDEHLALRASDEAWRAYRYSHGRLPRP